MAKIVVDSALNIPADLLSKFGIGVVPVSLTIDGKSYREGVDATQTELVSLIARSEALSTSQPSPGDFLEVYDQIGGDIVSLHITAKASGTHQSAVMAAGMTKAKVTVVDTANASMGGGWQALAAALLAEQGKPVFEIEAKAKAAKAETTTFLSVPTLKYLSRSGRVGLAKALLASLLSVKPILAFNDGVVEVVARSRSMTGACKEMTGMLKDKYGAKPLAVAVMHAEDAALAQQFQGLLAKTLNVQLALTTELTASLVVHGGPGTIAVAALPFEYVKGLRG
ncbi:MAG: DegV domain-containing protein [Firmicutes bacterium]|nr:DegV domain-containing protein [Bacillota bacterium]